jgi:hypothetical protein
MSGGREQPIDLSVSFVDRGDAFAVLLEGAGESAEREVALRDLTAVGTDLERLRRGEDLTPAGAEASGASGAARGRNELASLGQRLFSCLFEGADRALFVRAADAARREQRPFRLFVKLAHGSPLERIPWEILHDGHRFIAKEARCAVVRYFYDRQEVPSFQVAAPLRVLVTSACPPPHAPRKLEAEIQAILEAYRGAERLVCPVVQRNVSLDQLEDLWRGAELRRKPFHVWHHCGHGHHTQGGGEPRFLLSLERRGMAEYVNVDQLSEVVGACPELRLAVLNVCHGGSPDGLVPELARLNVPVVIGYGSAVANDLAYKFAAALHQALLHIPVELAVSLARRALARHSVMELEWSLPLLFSRRSDWGPILRWPVARERTAAQARRGPRTVTVEVNGVKAGGDVIVSGTEEAGAARHSSLPDRVRVKASQISARGSVDVAGVRRVGGFSEPEMRLREQRMEELLRELASRFSRGEGQHER